MKFKPTNWTCIFRGELPTHSFNLQGGLKQERRLRLVNVDSVAVITFVTG